MEEGSTFHHKSFHKNKLGHGHEKHGDPHKDKIEFAVQYDKAMTEGVIKLQRAYRLSRFVYRHFGPELFVDASGHSSSGRVLFEGGAEPARWINVASTCNVQRLARFMDNFWQMPKPEVLITVTGGAQDFQLSNELQVAFDRGLVSAAQSAKAWIFTAGSDTGVMRLVGDAMYRFKVPLPVVGIFPWGVVNERDSLRRATVTTEGGLTAATYNYAKPTREGAPLNPHHTHFVFVDNGKRGGAAWGSEIELRSNLEATLARTKNIPIVQLVVQGGPGTLATVESTALAGKPIVVLVDSGGAATALHKYCTLGLDAVEPRFHAQNPKLESIKNLNDIYGGKQLLFFSLEGSTDGGQALDMSSALLEAVVKMLNQPSAVDLLSLGATVKHAVRGVGKVVELDLPEDRIVVQFEEAEEPQVYTKQSIHKLSVISGGAQAEPEQPTHQQSHSVQSQDGEEEPIDLMLVRTLNLTVVWDRPELVRKILMDVKAEEPGALREVHVAMQRGLELQRSQVVKLFLDLTGMTMESIDMGQLYMRPDESKFLSNNRPLKARLRMMLSEKADPVKAQRPHALYQKALSRFFYSISPILRQELYAVDYTRPNDVFYWLTCHGNEQMARDVWPHCDNPVHAALLGAIICKKMSQVISQGQAAAEERATRMQEWAFGALEAAPDEKHAHDVLERSIRDDRVFTALDIALRTGAKNFLFQRHCVSLIDRQWRGDVPGAQIVLSQDFSWAVLVLKTIFPFANRHLYAPGKSSEKIGDINYGSTVFYDALGLAFSLSALERRTLQASSPKPLLKKGVSHIEVCERVNRFEDIIKESASMKPVVEVAPATTLLERLRAFYTVPAVKFILRMLTQLYGTLLYLVIIFEWESFANLQDAIRCGLSYDELKGFALPPSSPPGFSMQPEPSAPQEPSAPTNWDGSAPSFDLPCNPFDMIPFLHDALKGKAVWEILWIQYELALWIDLRHQQMVRSRLGIKGKAGIERVSVVSDVLIIVALCCRLWMEFEYAVKYDAVALLPPGQEADEKIDKSRELYHWYQIFISIKVLIIGIGWLPYLSEYRPLGVLIIMVSEMISDIVNWMLLFAVMTFSFMVMLAGLQSAGRYTNEDPHADITADLSGTASAILKTNFDRTAAASAFWSPLWSLFGEFDPGMYDWICSIVMWFYCLIGSVVLVNLLVAAFADTYTRVKTASEMEYVYLRCTRLFEYKHVILAVPSVFNTPYVLFDMLMSLRQYGPVERLCRCCCPGGGPRPGKSGGVSVSASVSYSASSPDGASRPSGLTNNTPLTPSPSAKSFSPNKKKRNITLFDGKLLAANYLREARKKEADTVHAHARALRNELLQGMKQREAEMLRLSTRVSKMESSLIPIHQNLDTLLRLQIDPEEESKARLTTSARRRLSDESYLSGFLNALPTVTVAGIEMTPEMPRWMRNLRRPTGQFASEQLVPPDN